MNISPFLLLFSVGAANAFSIGDGPARISRTRTPRIRKPTSVEASTLQRTGDETNETHDEGEGECEVLILDHLNINHEKGRHDIVKAFYFDFLGLAVDPRKYENIAAGSKTLVSGCFYLLANT